MNSTIPMTSTMPTSAANQRYPCWGPITVLTPLMTAFTSERLQLAAVNVPCACAGEPQSASAKQSDPSQLIPVRTNVDRLQKERIFIVICFILGPQGKRYQLSRRPVLGQLTSAIVLRKRRKLNSNRPIRQVSSYLERFNARTKTRITRRPPPRSLANPGLDSSALASVLIIAAGRDADLEPQNCPRLVNLCEPYQQKDEAARTWARKLQMEIMRCILCGAR